MEIFTKTNHLWPSKTAILIQFDKKTWLRFGTTDSGGVLSTVVTEGRRYSSCRLSDNNND